MTPLYMGRRTAKLTVTNVPPHRDQARVLVMVEEYGEVIELKSTPQQNRTGTAMEFQVLVTPEDLGNIPNGSVSRSANKCGCWSKEENPNFSSVGKQTTFRPSVPRERERDLIGALLGLHHPNHSHYKTLVTQTRKSLPRYAQTYH